MEIKAIPANKSADNQKVVEGAKGIRSKRSTNRDNIVGCLKIDDTVEHHSDKIYDHQDGQTVSHTSKFSHYCHPFTSK